jgi:hypothetical protein
MNNWGVSEEEAEKMFQEEKLKRAFLHNIYKEPYVVYYVEDSDIHNMKKICEINNMGDFAFSEWMSFYRDRIDNLRKQCNITGVIPIITKEECVACGL